MQYIEFFFDKTKIISSNKAKTITKRGKFAQIIKTKELRHFQNHIYSIAHKHIKECKEFEKDYDSTKEYVQCIIEIGLPNLMTKKGTISKTSSDLDNSLKYLIDSVFKCFEHLNDAFICDLRVIKKPTEKNEVKLRLIRQPLVDII